MPITVSIRKDFSSAVFRNAVVKALSSPGITEAYIASGFFEEFTDSLEKRAPDYAFGEAMEGKKIFLFGGYQKDVAKAKLFDLRNALRAKNLQVETYLPKAPADDSMPELIWHAKLAVFVDVNGPVLAIAGSSNFTGSSMFGPSDVNYLERIQRVNVEADTYFWKKGCQDADEVMYCALNDFSSGKEKIAFDKDEYDDEISKLIEYTYLSILNSGWDKMP